MSSFDLKPCPFCGGEAELCQYGNEEEGGLGFEVRCRSCHESSFYRFNDIDAVADWNRMIDEFAAIPETKDNARNGDLIRYISLFSGIECATVAAKPLGWEPICFAEIDPFPSAVLAHHYPDVPNVGDVAAHDWSRYRGCCDVVIGGSPCQAFSVAGRRESLADERGNLTLAFTEAVNAVDPAFVVWENVPGVLNTRDNAFGCFLAALAGDDRPLDAPDGGAWSNAGVVVGSRRVLAWRILDAQYFGVPQRRRRVFVVGCPRTSGVDPGEILFEQKGLRRDYSPRRKTGKGIAGTLASRTRGGGGLGSDFEYAGGLQVVGTLGCGGKAAGSATSQDAEQGLLLATARCLTCSNTRIDAESETLIVGTLTARGRDGTRLGNSFDLQGGLQPVAFDTTQITSPGNHSNPKLGDLSHSIAAGAHPPAVAFLSFHGSQDPDVSGGVMHPVGRNQGQETCVAHIPANAVRRLTPCECERLQGLPDNYTFVPWRDGMAADGPRYKALGNGMAVPCVRWILARIDVSGKGGYKEK